MAYDSADLRSRMSSAAPTSDSCSPPAYFDFTLIEPDVTPKGSRTWWVRGQNFALAYTIAQPGEVLTRSHQPDEYVALFATDRVGARVRSGAEEVAVDAATLVIVPPGDSEIAIDRETHVVRLFSAASEDLLKGCLNNGDYADPHANVTLFTPWPDPPRGFKLRAYRIAEYPYQEGRFARIFRCTTFMVNVFDPDLDPRDPSKLSPHAHTDFEQCSLAVRGEYIHHIRTPWTSNLASWREDEHVRTSSPSVAIIPPPSIHTSQSVGQAGNQLVDIFCPPRADFSAQPGWVLNAADYPAPTEPLP